MTGLLLRDLATTSAEVAATSARLGKVGLLADVLGRADPDEAAAAVAFLSGELRQRQIGVGWATLRDGAAAGGRRRPCAVGEVDAALRRDRRPCRAPARRRARRELLGRPVRPGHRPTSSGSCVGLLAASCARARSRA